jgi:hypothetical protein
VALPKTFDGSRPTNSVEAGAAWAGVSRGLAYEECRGGAWPCQRVGSRLLILTRPFLAMFPAAESLGLDAGGPESDS